jgi:hypothetical protein
MAVFKVRKVRRALVNKLQAEEEYRTHIAYLVFDDNGILLGETYISHGATEIGDPLVGQMARQLNISLPLWRDIIHCPKGRAEYIIEAGQ